MINQDILKSLEGKIFTPNFNRKYIHEELDRSIFDKVIELQSLDKEQNRIISPVNRCFTDNKRYFLSKYS